jgi:hypothetical protein
VGPTAPSTRGCSPPQGPNPSIVTAANVTPLHLDASQSLPLHQRRCRFICFARFALSHSSTPGLRGLQLATARRLQRSLEVLHLPLHPDPPRPTITLTQTRRLPAPWSSRTQCCGPHSDDAMHLRPGHESPLSFVSFVNSEFPIQSFEMSLLLHSRIVPHFY